MDLEKENIQVRTLLQETINYIKKGDYYKANIIKDDIQPIIRENPYISQGLNEFSFNLKELRKMLISSKNAFYIQNSIIEKLTHYEKEYNLMLSNFNSKLKLLHTEDERKGIAELFKSVFIKYVIEKRFSSPEGVQLLYKILAKHDNEYKNIVNNNKDAIDLITNKSDISLNEYKTVKNYTKSKINLDIIELIKKEGINSNSTNKIYQMQKSMRLSIGNIVNLS